jgi:DNA-binding response OmpR family regulator
MGHIAIAEPDGQVRQLFAELVAELGHEDVAVAPFDLLILEPAWPAGRQLAERLRAEQPDLPILCASSRPPDAWVDGTADLFLLKPFTLDAFREAVTKTLRRA